MCNLRGDKISASIPSDVLQRMEVCSNLWQSLYLISASVVAEKVQQRTVATIDPFRAIMKAEEKTAVSRIHSASPVGFSMEPSLPLSVGIPGLSSSMFFSEHSASISVVFGSVAAAVGPVSGQTLASWIVLAWVNMSGVSF